MNTIKDLQKSIIELTKLKVSDEDLDKELGYLVWEVKRKMLNKLRDLSLELPEKTFSQLDEAVK